MKAILNNRIIQHIAFWCFYLFIYYYNYKKDEPVMTGVIVTLLSMTVHLFFTYSQLYLLIPRYLLKKRIALYFFLTFLFAKIATNISFLLYSFVVFPLRAGIKKPEVFWDNLWTFRVIHVSSYFSIFTICGIAVSIKLLKKWYQENERNRKIEKEKLAIELEMLKAQVHPHFLFNTLNNLYSLTLQQSDKAPLVVTHLSDLLRYMLYECNEKEVPLEKEIEVLHKYIELEKLRYGNRIDVSFSCSGDIKQNTIAPLILFPFVENSFKHGVSEQIDQCWVNLHMHADGNNFSFNLSNSFIDGNTKSITSGIGLQNIKKRLELIYPGKYELTISEEADMFIVKLQLQLNPAVQPQVVTVSEKTFINPIPAAV